ncbi:MAG TPA: FecR domain-containing protein [Rhodanobacteraceae bacterium]|nr:FecR domain-containing protein [Rhodanobacteraceae bacterium]
MPSKNDKLRQLISEQAAEWHAVQREGPLSDEQASELVRWLQTSPLHVSEYLSMAQLERAIADVARSDATPLAALLADPGAPVRALPVAGAFRHPGRPGAPSDRPRVRGRRRRRVVRRAALAACATLGLALVGWHWLGTRAAVETLATRRGQELTTRLADHTLLKLDAESRVIVRFSRARREVEVARGQAYFEVAADAARPFGVRAGPIVIRDIGTTFDVYRHTTGTTITVVRGHVEVAAPGGRGIGARGARPLDPVATLGPGQQVRVSDGGRVLAAGAADLWQALGWTHGRITFENMPIGEVAAQFNRYNATRITVRSPAIGTIRITGTFQADGVASFVRFLEGLPGVAVRTRGQQVTVDAPRSGDQ